MRKKVLCLLSGGIDSFVLLDFLLRNNMKAYCLFIDYGQLSAKYEFNAFLKICKLKKINWYQKIQLKNFGEMINTGLTRNENINAFFPSRNLLLITIASAFLDEINCSYISIGIIKSANFYPDCTRSYIEKLELIISESIKREIKIFSPIENFTKLDVIKYSVKYHLPIECSYSCEKGVRNHCKTCHSCLERFEALNWLKLSNKINC